MKGKDMMMRQTSLVLETSEHLISPDVDAGGAQALLTPLLRVMESHIQKRAKGGLLLSRLKGSGDGWRQDHIWEAEAAPGCNSCLQVSFCLCAADRVHSPPSPAGRCPQRAAASALGTEQSANVNATTNPLLFL